MSRADGGRSYGHPQVVATATSLAEMLAEFHEAFGQPFGHGNVHDCTCRVNLHKEEQKELLDEFDAANLVGIARELADVVYVAFGSAHSLGIDLYAVLAEVHRANMSKFGPDGHPVLRADGKILKGPNFIPPDVPAVLGLVQT